MNQHLAYAEAIPRDPNALRLTPIYIKGWAAICNKRAEDARERYRIDQLMREHEAHEKKT